MSKRSRSAAETDESVEKSPHISNMGNARTAILQCTYIYYQYQMMAREVTEDLPTISIEEIKNA